MHHTRSALAALILSIIALSGCTPSQLSAWYDAVGIDHSALTPEQLDHEAAVATAIWEAPPVTIPPAPLRPSLPPYLVCVRWRESRGDYTAYNASSGASGAFQFMPTTARNTALHAGRSDLAYRGVLSWSPADQDLMAIHLLNWYGPSPWAGPGC